MQFDPCWPRNLTLGCKRVQPFYNVIVCLLFSSFSIIATCNNSDVYNEWQFCIILL